MFEIRSLVKLILLPPFNQFILLALAWLLKDRFVKTSRILFWLAFFSLYAVTTPLVSGLLVRSAEKIPAVSVDGLKNTGAEAIVVLSGGQQKYAPEFGGSASFSDSLFRLRYAAYLHRQTELPMLLAGGRLYDFYPQSLAETMQDDLQRSFGMEARWLEMESKTTHENAQFSYKILEGESIQRIILVTSAMHMARAKILFERAGFRVVPAPTLFADKLEEWDYRSVLPAVWSLEMSYQALHEHLGNLYYLFVAR